MNRPLRVAGIWTVGAFLLNFAWEVTQRPLYADMGMSRWEKVLECARASVGDVGIVLGLFGFMVLATGRPDWFRRGWRSLAALALAGLALAVSFELHALLTGRWEYGEAMPIVPILEVGVTPLLQMSVLPVVLVLSSRLALGERS